MNKREQHHGFNRVWYFFQCMQKKITIVIACIVFQFMQQGYAENLQPNLKPMEDDFIISEYQFVNGQRLSNLKLHYATLGNPKYDQDGQISNAVLMLHWTGASGAVLLTSNFKEVLYAPGKPLDANQYFLIFPDSIGCGQSSKPSDGLRMDFPQYGYHDMVHLQYKLVTEALGIKHLKMIIGTSMGGMHTWLWSELYPTFMDGAMPIVSLPTSVSGRNLLWRQMVIQAIKTDPEWRNGQYTTTPHGLIAAWPFAAMLLNGVPRLQRIIQGVPTALNFIQEIEKEVMKKDANDIIYVLEASMDYNPEPKLSMIQTKVFALDFTDDQLDPIEFHTLETLIKNVKNGRTVIQEGTPYSYGHMTMAHPELWADQVTHFLHYINQEK
jgi:homoserine O-acetyltransferase